MVVVDDIVGIIDGGCVGVSSDNMVDSSGGDDGVGVLLWGTVYVAALVLEAEVI